MTDTATVDDTTTENTDEPTTDEQTVEGEDQGNESESNEDEAKRAKTSYAGRDFAMEVLDDLPENAEGGRSRIYFDILQAIAEDSENLGRWHVVAKFGTDQGAVTVANNLNKQVAGKVLTEDQAAIPATERPAEVRGFIKPEECKDIPEYDGWHYEFDARKVASTRIGHRDSVLYARLVQDQA